jgi:NAD(P) transhydrogenase
MNSQVFDYDVLVIGSGPGGEGAAMQAVKQGLKTAVIEKSSSVGGSCTHLGTIPSKSLRHVAHRLTTFINDPLFSRENCDNICFSTFLARAQEVISKQVARRQSHYTRNNVPVIRGQATFVDEHTLGVLCPDGLTKKLTGRSIIIACGSKPRHPEDIDFTHERIFDSDSILSLKHSPKHIIIYGAGIVGCEYASIFKALNTKVTLINTHDKLLSFLDDEISGALSYHFREKGIHIKKNERYSKIIATESGVTITLESGKRILGDALLVTLGRIGDSKILGLSDLGIQITPKGHIAVNERYQTSVPNIYAVGDITGFPGLASAAYDQGRFAALHILDPNCDMSLVKDMPYGVYTSPEISFIGATEAQLTQAKIPYEVGSVAFRFLARAQITGQTVGMMKLLFHSETLEILGIHCFGQNSAEIIHIGQAIMSQPAPYNSIKYFINTTFNYPTMAEAYRVAALNGLNRLKEQAQY